MKQREYTEGPEALANFEQFARAILQAPKPKIKATAARGAVIAIAGHPENAG